MVMHVLTRRYVIRIVALLAVLVASAILPGGPARATSVRGPAAVKTGLGRSLYRSVVSATCHASRHGPHHLEVLQHGCRSNNAPTHG